MEPCSEHGRTLQRPQDKRRQTEEPLQKIIGQRSSVGATGQKEKHSHHRAIFGRHAGKQHLVCARAKQEVLRGTSPILPRRARSGGQTGICSKSLWGSGRGGLMGGREIGDREAVRTRRGIQPRGKKIPPQSPPPRQQPKVSVSPRSGWSSP